MRVRVDRAKCVGHGRCYVLGPEVFTDDERGHCVVRAASVPHELETQARLGEENCPEAAISLDADRP
jgi:ferredoxin